MITKDRTGHVFKKGNRFYLQYMVDSRRVKQVVRDAKGNPVTTAAEAELRRKAVMAPMMVAEREDALRSVVTKLGEAVQEREATERGTDSGLTLVKAWESYVASVNRPDSGSRTLAGYEAQWRQFVDWVAKTRPAVTKLRQVSAPLAEAYAEYMLKDIREKRKKAAKADDDKADTEEVVVKRAYSTNTYNKHVRVLELVFRVLARKAAMTGNPWSEIARKTEIKASRRELTVQELNTICNRAQGEMQTLFVIGIYTGLRFGDCCTLRWAEVDMARKIVLRVPNKTARRHAQPVHVPIHPTLFGVLEQTPVSKRSGFVLPGLAQRYKKDPTGLTRLLGRHFQACGIQVHKEGTGVNQGPRAVVEVGFHSLRHSFVSLCRQSNAPLAVVEAIVGHSNPAMTRHYTHTGDEAAVSAVAALPDITGEPVKALPPADPVAKLKAELLAIVESMTVTTWKSAKDQLTAMLQEKSAVG